MPSRETYLFNQSLCGLEIGDSVRVLRRAHNLEAGWPEHWASDMANMIGGVYKITDTSSYGYELDNSWVFPWFVLEKVDADALQTGIETPSVADSETVDGTEYTTSY
jgi:hypothetical protein